MIDSLRHSLRTMRGIIGHLDGLLCEMDPARLPDLQQAAAAVELANIAARLSRLADNLEAATTTPPAASGRPLASGDFILRLENHP